MSLFRFERREPEGRMHFLTKSNSLNTYFSSSGTSIVSKWHLVSFTPLLSAFTASFIHIFFHNDRSTGWAELAMFIKIAKQCGDQPKVCFVRRRSGSDGSKMDMEVILLWMNIPWVAEVFAAYTVTSSSECEGSCPRS